MDASSYPGLVNISGSQEKVRVQNEEEKDDLFDLKQCETDSKKTHCEKYIPATEISLDKLPEEIRSQEILDSIKTRCELTVKVQASYVSTGRPDFYEDKQDRIYPLKFMKGSNYNHCGTGIITNVLTDKPITQEDCPCPLCEKTPKKQWWQLIVCTATHVIHNEEEAQKAVFECFYDKEDQECKSNIGKLYGLGIQYSITRMDELHLSDLCEVICVTHDEKVMERISAVFKEIEKNPKLAEQPSQVIVAHPLGKSKKISFGNVWYITVPVHEEFECNIPTAFKNHTKCRLPPNPTESSIQPAGTPTTESEAKEKPLDIPNIQKKAMSSIAEMLFQEGFKNYVSIYLIPAMEAWMIALEFMKDMPLNSKSSRDKVIKHVHESLGKIKSNVQTIKQVQRNQSREKLTSVFDTLLARYKNLEKTCENSDDLFNKIQNELLNIFYPQIGDLIFKQDKRTATWHVATERDKENYKRAFTMVIDFYNKVFENIHPECEIILNYIEKEFGNMMHLTISYMRRTMFASLRKCPTYTVNMNRNPRLEFVLPAGATFTLPTGAEYAFRYYSGKPGWFKFPSGTRFAYNDGTPLYLPAEAEFRNDAFYPTQCKVTHDIETCDGSSGAAIYCDLLDMPFMTVFPHEGQKIKEGDELLEERYSGLQTNRFTTFLLNLSSIIEQMARKASEEYEAKMKQ